MRTRAAVTLPDSSGGVIALINFYGLEGAVGEVFVSNIENGLTVNEATRYLKIYRSCLNEARTYSESAYVSGRFLMLAKFYRLLAHKIYWATKRESDRCLGFIQEL